MKRIALIIIVVIMAHTSYGQGIDLGVKAGANFASITDASGLKNRTGLVFGAFLGLKLNDKFTLQPELLYSQQGAKFDVSEINLDYVNVPVVAKIFLIQGLNVQVGPQFGFLVNDNVEGDIETFDIAGLAGVGYDLPFGLRIDARYNFGLTKLNKDADGKNGVFTIALGYSFL